MPSKQQSDLVVSKRSVDDLIPYVNNAKQHSDNQIDLLAGSIKEFGFNNPILIDGDNGIIAGHGRLLAAQKLGMTEVPVIELAHLTETQKKAYVLADNRLGEVGTNWDMELVNIELESLIEDEFDIDLTGFNFDSGDEAEESEGDYDLDKKEYLLIVDCDSEHDQGKLFDDLSSKGYKVRPID